MGTDPQDCIKKEAVCALGCLKTISVASAETQVTKKKLSRTEKKMLTCQKNCALDYGECLVNEFEVKKCTQEEARCGLECFRTLKVEASPAVEGAATNKCDLCLTATYDIVQQIIEYGCDK